MRLFDLHCDSLTECFRQNLSLYDNDKTAVTLKGKKDYIQAFALYIEQGMPRTLMRKYFIDNFEFLASTERNIENFDIVSGKLPRKTDGKIFGIRTVENCELLYDLNNFDLFLEYNIFAASLTHNEKNCLAGGALSDGSVSEQGYSVVKLFDDNNIVLDISHLNDKSCFEVLSFSDKTVIATHSNSRAVTDNKRNLPDEFFKEVVARDGIVGINLHCPFLSENAPTFDDILKHIYHFLSIGGEDTVSLGCDMDGAVMPSEIQNLAALEKLYDYMLKLNFSEQLTDKIFYKNAYDFFAKRRV